MSAPWMDRVVQLARTGHAPPLEEAIAAAAAGRLWDIDTGFMGEDSIVIADSAEEALDEVADHAEYPRRLAHEGGVLNPWRNEPVRRPWTATRIGGAS